MEENVKSRVVGVDISVKRTTMAIVDIRGNIIAKDHFPTSDYPNVNEFVSVLSEKIIMLTEANGGYDKIRSIGMSAPSANFLTGCIENAANLPWKGVIPLAAMLRDQMGIAVALANDAHVTALGEYSYGSAHGMSNFIIITLGHGIGSCVFSDGKAHLGADGFAGEIGHICIEHDGWSCGCGRKGCLEAYCAHNGIVRTANDLLASTDKPSLMRQLDDITPRTISDCCAAGDELAIEVYRLVGERLGGAMAGFATLFDPEAIIFTGGIANAGDWLFKPAHEAFECHVFRNIRGRVKFLRSMIDDRERDVLGASALAWGIKEYSLFK
ncbi:ROK family protein [Prevotella sp. E9-3]|uniref:ROK family protein n=1 Tax=Prevotella sp. E9-3 TaxID=2913621 RepID=UPI001EDC114C|nr:ROK family protein [Prevotella sp. E9-3]UKK49311.1 ROK family protein [Prevotella sp. E9-3]